MAPLGNEIELVLRFDRGYDGDATGRQHRDTRCASGYKWSFTARRTQRHHYALTLECTGAPLRGGTARVIFSTSFDQWPTDHEFERYDDFLVRAGASIHMKTSFTTLNYAATARARITVDQQSVPRPNALYDFTTGGTTGDARLKVGESIFYANKGVLSVVSPVFCAMFNDEFREKHADEVPLEGIEPADFEAFLGAVYPNGPEPTGT